MLADKDRIFTNVHGFQPWNLKAAQKRGDWDKTANLLKIGQDEIIERIKASALDEVVITNTIPLNEAAKSTPKIRQLSTAFLFAETIRRITDGDSVTSLFSEQNSNF